jgi:hypothetical protein
MKRKLFWGAVLVGLLALGIIGSGAAFAQTAGASRDHGPDHAASRDHGADHAANRDHGADHAAP